MKESPAEERAGAQGTAMGDNVRDLGTYTDSVWGECKIGTVRVERGKRKKCNRQPPRNGEGLSYTCVYRPGNHSASPLPAVLSVSVCLAEQDPCNTAPVATTSRSPGCIDSERCLKPDNNCKVAKPLTFTILGWT